MVQNQVKLVEGACHHLLAELLHLALPPAGSMLSPLKLHQCKVHNLLLAGIQTVHRFGGAQPCSLGCSQQANGEAGQ